MILFTGSGEIGVLFAKMYDCKIISARNLDEANLTKEIMSADVIIHNAALINSLCLDDLLDGNFILTKKIVEIAKKVNPTVKFIFISSMSFLKTEDSYMKTDEMSDYAFSKYMAEIFCKRQPMNIISVRFSTIFYGNEKKDGLSKLVYDCVNSKALTVYNNGVAQRDFIPIAIVCQYLYKLSKGAVEEKVINLVSGRPINFKYFVDRLIRFEPKTKVVNIFNEMPEILSKFSNNDIIALGEIPFNVEELFDEYFFKLNESINL